MFWVGRRHVEGGGYLAGVDGLRAIAVLTVMVFHLIPSALPGGFVGVDVFFVISGYVVTNSMLRQKDRPAGEFIAGFYARRFRRILPPLILCLCVTIPLAFAVIPEAFLSKAIQSTAISAFFGVSNFALIATNDGYFATGAASNPFTHTWSLAVEEQFYLIFPIMLYGAVHSTRGRAASLSRRLLVAATLASFAFCAWATAYSPDIAYYSLPSRFWELAAGAGAAMLGEQGRRSIVERVGHATLMNTGLVLIGTAAFFADEHLFPMPWAVPACLGSLAVVLASGFPGKRRSLGNMLENPILVSIGLLSYALYLWHWPIYTIMRWTFGLNTPYLYLIAIMLTGIAAWLSYILVEYPTQNWKFFSKQRSSVTIIVSIAVIGAGVLYARGVYDRPWRFKLTATERNSADWIAYTGGGNREGRICDVRASVGQYEWKTLSPTNCRVPPVPGPRIFVIGDSHAGAYERMLRAVVTETGRPVIIASQINCASANFILPARAQTTQCAGERNDVRILRVLKQGDIVFLASLRSIRLSNQTGPVPDAKVVALASSPLAERHRVAARLEAEQLIDRLSSAGAIVVLDCKRPVRAFQAER